MGKYKILIRKGGNSISGVTEEFDFMLSPNLSFNDMGYYTRFYMYDKKGARIGNIFVICSYQRPGVVNELIDFDAPYKIVEELPSSYATVMDESLYYKLCYIFPKGEDRADFANSLRIMHYGNYWDVWDSDCFQKGCLRNYTRQTIPFQKQPKDALFQKLFRNARNFYDFKYDSYRVTIGDGNIVNLKFGLRRIVWINDFEIENPTKAMYEIALSLYTHATNKKTETPLVEPVDSEINKVIFVSYKSFLDDYTIPPITKEFNKEAVNFYCYVGLQSRFDLGDYDVTDGSILTIDKVSIRKVNSIASDLQNSMISDKIDNWDKISTDYASLYNDESLEKILKQINVHVGDSACWTHKNFGEKDFHGLEYKHKLFIHCLGMIGRNIQPYSIILLDRPDMFFDTKQMSFLLSTLYDMCEKMDSCVIINTKE